MVKEYTSIRNSVKAVLWTGDNIEEIRSFCRADRVLTLYSEAEPDEVTFQGYQTDKRYVLTTGQLLVREFEGCFRTATADIFLMNYMEVK